MPALTCINGHEALPGDSFCRYCGQAVARVCPQGHLVSQPHSFCQTCGTRVGLPGEPDGVIAPPILAADRSGPDTHPRATTATTPTTPTVPLPLALSEPPPLPAAGWPATPGDPPHPGGQPRPWGRNVLFAGLAIIFLAGGVVGGVVLAKHSSNATQHISTGSPLQHESRPTSVTTVATPPPPTVAPTFTPSTVPPPQIAAQSLSTLLAQSVGDRSSIQGAVADVTRCGPNLGADIQTFNSAATSRSTLLNSLRTIPDPSALPTAMVQDLIGAWTESEQADQDFAGWARDESQNCSANDTSDPDFQAATQPDNAATAYKTAFVNIWNPIASRFGLLTYTPNDL